jgi:predicted Zn-dependent protease
MRHHLGRPLLDCDRIRFRGASLMTRTATDSPATGAAPTFGCACHERRRFSALLLASAAGVTAAACSERTPAPEPRTAPTAAPAAPPAVGSSSKLTAAATPECKRSAAASLAPAGAVESAARDQYAQLVAGARAKGALVGRDDVQLERLRYIAARIIPHAVSCNERAQQWRWEVNLLRSPQLNAFCMPAGKIAFFSGILTRLKLNDDEVAMIMGHEVAHALLEHARERLVKSTGTNVGLRLLAALFGLGNLGDLAAQYSAQLLSLTFSRSDESEADALGLVLAARAGYDPRAGVTLWRKMTEAAGSKAPPQWLSTHPAGAQRIKDIEARLPRALPEFQRAAAPERQFPVAV